jgi:hypothetical protein
MTRATSLRSRVKGNFQARFWSRGEGSDSLTDCNTERSHSQFVLHGERSLFHPHLAQNTKSDRMKVEGGGRCVSEAAR